jgi:protein involved in polysaccharide export with SLBB domain
LVKRQRNSWIAFAAALLILAPLSHAQGTQSGTPESSDACTSNAATGYRLQTGDDLTIKVFNRPELEETLRIRPDGKLSLVLLPDIQAAGCTPSALEQTLTKRYAEFFQDPRVTVIVRSFANQKVYVSGEVGQPGMIALTGELTALNAVLQAGGFKNSARTDSVILLRKDEHDQPLARRLNLRDVLHKGKAGDVVLQPFDVVYVPKSRIAKVDQFVEQWVRQVLPGTLTGGFSYISGNTVRLVP